MKKNIEKQLEKLKKNDFKATQQNNLSLGAHHEHYVSLTLLAQSRFDENSPNTEKKTKIILLVYIFFKFCFQPF